MKVTVLGMGPLPGQDAQRTHAPGIRTVQFARGLASAGNEVSLVVRFHGEGCPPLDTPPPEGLRLAHYAALSDSDFMTGDTVPSLLKEWGTQAIVAVTFLPSFRAASLGVDLPTWMDLFGEPMAEGQAKASVVGSDEVIQPYYDMLIPILQRGDRFSTVSRAQANAMEGQLALAGRMSRRTSYYRMVHPIPCALDPSVRRGDHSPLRGTLVPEDAFVVLWSGGFNTWCDVDTLYLGLDKAMSHDQRIHFVATGGELGEQDSVTYAHFRTLVERSPFRHRYHLQGWVPYGRLGEFYALADVAVNSDRNLLEVRLGTKTRFMEWIACRIPIITSRLSELSRDLERVKGVLAFAPGDAEGLATHLLWAVSNRDALRTIAHRAYQFASSRLTVEATTQAAAQWAKRPRRAPDWKGHLGLMEAREAKLREELQLTRNHVTHLEATIAHLQQALEASTRQTEEVRAQLSQEGQQRAVLESEISKLITDRDHWKANAAKLQERLTQQDQDFTKLREGLDQQIQHQRELLDEVARQLRYWEGVARKRDARVAELEEKVSTLQKELGEVQHQHATLLAQHQRLSEELASKEEDLRRLLAWRAKVQGSLPYRVWRLLKGKA